MKQIISTIILCWCFGFAIGFLTGYGVKGCEGERQQERVSFTMPEPPRFPKLP